MLTAVRQIKNAKRHRCKPQKVVAVFNDGCTEMLNAVLNSPDAPSVIGFANEAQERQIAAILDNRLPKQ